MRRSCYNKDYDWRRNKGSCCQLRKSFAQKGFKQSGCFILLEERAGVYNLRLATEKGGLFAISYPDDLSEKSATATCELSGILYYALKNRQRNLKAAHATPKEVRVQNGRKASLERWGSVNKNKK